MPLTKNLNSSPLSTPLATPKTIRRVNALTVASPIISSRRVAKLKESASAESSPHRRRKKVHWKEGEKEDLEKQMTYKFNSLTVTVTHDEESDSRDSPSMFDGSPKVYRRFGNQLEKFES